VDTKIKLPLPGPLKPYGKLVVFVLGQIISILAYQYLDDVTAYYVIQFLTGAGVFQQPNITKEDVKRAAPKHRAH